MSIIIPAYNSERYINQCLSSIFTQLDQSIEVILVDDGSTDKGIDIVKEKYEERIRSNHLKVIHQKNNGPGSARNHGIEYSSGKYIGFLDSDDLLVTGYFDSVLPVIRSDSPDIIEFDYVRFSSDLADSLERYEPQLKINGRWPLKDVRVLSFCTGKWFACTRIFRREVIKRYKFPINTFYEDLMLIPKIYLEEHSIFFIQKPLLGYRYNQSSTTSRHTIQQYKQLLGFYLKHHSFSNSEPWKILQLQIARTLFYFISELRPRDNMSATLIERITSLSLSSDTRKLLSFPDRFVYSCPALYYWTDRVRVPLKIFLQKIRAR